MLQIKSAIFPANNILRRAFRSLPNCLLAFHCFTAPPIPFDFSQQSILKTKQLLSRQRRATEGAGRCISCVWQQVASTPSCMLSKYAPHNISNLFAYFKISTRFSTYFSSLFSLFALVTFKSISVFACVPFLLCQSLIVVPPPARTYIFCYCC